MFVRRGFGRTPPETIGDRRTEFNRILCTSKSKAAVTGNKQEAQLSLTNRAMQVCKVVEVWHMFIRFDMIPNVTDRQTDRQTDGQTDTARRHRPRLCMAR